MYSLMRLMPQCEGPLKNAVTESAVLHARNLCNFFCGFGDPEDIRLGDIFDLRQNPRLSELKKNLKAVYAKTKNEVNPRQSFNRLLAHMSKHRESSPGCYSYDPEFSVIDPILRKIRDEVVLPFFQLYAGGQ